MSGSDRARGEFGRVAVTTLAGLTLGALLGGIVAAVVQNDPGVPLDWSTIAIGLGVGAVVGAVVGVVIGITRPRRRGRHVVGATPVPEEPNAIEPEIEPSDLTRGTPHAADPRLRTGHGAVVP